MTVERAPAARIGPVTGSLTGSGARISQRLEALALCSDEAGKTTRFYLDKAHRLAVDMVSGWMREAGLSTRLDAAGSVVGRYEAVAANAPALLIGSHIDSVPDAGRFDGALGVVTAIEAVDALYKSGRRLPFAIEVVAFGDEEGSRFPATLSGSRALAGTFDAATLDETDRRGVSRREALIAFGCDPGRIAVEARRPDQCLGYVEVHIEQGPVLEAKGLPLGVVTAINGASRGTVEVQGVGGHAGTIPMNLRKDALSAAAEMVLAIERIAVAQPDLVATVGRIEIAGAAINSVPGHVRFTLDVRSPTDAQRLACLAAIEHELGTIARHRAVELKMCMSYSASATTCDPVLSNLVEQAIADLGIEVLRLPSGAGHDAMSFRGILPVAMLFVRCAGGISHSPREFASPDDIELGARALLGFLGKLAAQS